jgi:hypothetical protein
VFVEISEEVCRAHKPVGFHGCDDLIANERRGRNSATVCLGLRSADVAATGPRHRRSSVEIPTIFRDLRFELTIIFFINIVGSTM